MTTRELLMSALETYGMHAKSEYESRKAFTIVDYLEQHGMLPPIYTDKLPDGEIPEGVRRRLTAKAEKNDT
jgi:hypothetical protein